MKRPFSRLLRRPVPMALVLAFASGLWSCQSDGSGIGADPWLTGGGNGPAGGGAAGPAPMRDGAGGSAGAAASGNGPGAHAPDASAADPSPDSGAPADAKPPDSSGGTVGTTSVDAAPPAAPPGFCPSTDRLVLCLRFESSLMDESGQGLPVRGEARFAPGMDGQALDVGAESRHLVPDSPALSSPAVTIEAKVRPRELGRRMAILHRPGHYGLYILPSGNVMCSGRGGYALRGAAEPGRWLDLRCTFSGDSVALWMDGNKVEEKPADPLPTDRPGGLHIGWEDQPGRHFDGLIDNVRVWRGVAPAAE